MFVYCDVNVFYVSCQIVFWLDLKGWLVVVLLNNDGCVIVCLVEVKLFVKMGEFYFKQKVVFFCYGVVVFSSNYELYVDMFSWVMVILEEFILCCEIYSIDEVFCDVSGVCYCRDLIDFGCEICVMVLQCIYLMLGVGIVQIKILVKLVNYVVKQWLWQMGGVVDLFCLQWQ